MHGYFTGQGTGLQLFFQIKKAQCHAGTVSVCELDYKCYCWGSLYKCYCWGSLYKCYCWGSFWAGLASIVVTALQPEIEDCEGLHPLKTSCVLESQVPPFAVQHQL